MEPGDGEVARAEALLVLRDACPSFDAFAIPQYVDDPGGYGEMAEVSALARHLVDLAEQSDAQELPAVFAAVDHLLAMGDDGTVALVRTSLLEDIQNITSHRDVRATPEQFRSLLGPFAVAAWDDLDASWSDATAGDGRLAARPGVEEYLDLDPEQRQRVQAMTRELPDGTLARPSDVLRYETGQYDEELGRYSAIRRRALLVVVGCVVVVAMVVQQIVR